MRLTLAALALMATTGTAVADQFIATFFNANHPRNLRITMTQFDAAGQQIDSERRRLARVGPTQSTWAVILQSNVARACVSLTGNERATGGTVSLNNGQSQTLRVGHEITQNGQQICPSADPNDIGIVIINFE